MKSVCVGVHVHAEPAGLLTTLASLQANTDQAASVILLPDGPDQPTQQALKELRHLAQGSAPEPKGAAACFNRLVSAADADVFVLLESGSIVGPGWLDHLLAALDADSRHGLAGPSTNRSWNEQGVFPRAGGTPAQVQAAAQEAQRRFGPAWRTLEPLYSLADFCYAVKREVVQAIGAADEGYGLGPCWEMDYNIRAARAGFTGVWACAAYVWRPPFTPRRRLEEQRRFQASRQRYQDKFCGLRLRGERPGYELHCRGDACGHFASPGLIQLHLPLAAAPAHAAGPAVAPPTPVAPRLEHPAPRSTPAEPAAQPALAHLAPHGAHSMPLVTCLMPTRNRRDYALQSIRYLQRQDYANWELIILDDGDDELAGCLPDDARIRYQAVRRGLSIGAKRNQGCSLAQGEIIAQWDDDDWYGPQRLSLQIEPLLAGTADISGLQDTVFCDLQRWQFWRCTPALHRRLFVEDVHGGTLVFRKELWQRAGGYPDRSLAEDAWFLRQAIRQRARLARLSGAGQFVYLRHGGNAWAFTCGQYLDPSGWQRLDHPPVPPEDLDFYAARTAAPQAPAGPAPLPTRHASMLDVSLQGVAQPPTPLVSCIMPTANRRIFVGQAIQYFLRQDYPNRELIVVDDGADPVGDLMPADERVRYVRLTARRSVGAKRNLACEAAAGEIVVHWDDDDWSAPRRLAYQVDDLARQGADIGGLATVFYYDPWQRQAWQYVYPPHAQAWAAGNTLCYRKDYWRKNPFADIDVGEDTRFVQAQRTQRLAVLSDATFFVAMIHAHNVSPKRPGGTRWRGLAAAQIEALLGDDLAFYAGLRA